MELGQVTCFSYQLGRLFQSPGVWTHGGVEIRRRWMMFSHSILPKVFVSALAVTVYGFVLAPSAAQTIPYSAIIAAPDDYELNLRYARQEVASGHLLQAAAALERILLLKPNWDSVRLFYGVVLYRLDDLQGAIRELELLEGRGLSASQERDRVRYLNLALQRSSPFRFSARYTLGMRLDSNPGRSPEDVALRPVGDEGSDLGLTGSSRFRMEADIPNGQGDYVFFQSNTYINDFFEADTADLISSRSKAGLVLHGPGRIITPYVLYGSSWIQYENFRHQFGGGVDSEWSLSAKLDLKLGVRAAYEDFKTTSFSAVGNQRDGWRKSISAGLKFRPMDTQIFRLNGAFANKDAQFDGFSYDQTFVEAKSLTLFGEGRYLSLTASFTTTDYEQPDNFNSTTITREDERYFLRAAVGAPLETLFSYADVELPQSLGDITAQVGVSYTHQDSTINRLNHDNWSGDIMFTKRVNF